jgi:hypothetical protein
MLQSRGLLSLTLTLSVCCTGRWTLHGVAHVELGGRDFWPAGCGPGGGAGSPPGGAAAAPVACRPASGDTALAYWELSLGVPQVVGVLLAFYAALHVASYAALARLHRQRR